MHDAACLAKNQVVVAGNPDARRTLVFSHGFGTDQSTWQTLTSSFRDDYRLVLFDHVGGGRADPAAFEQHRYLNLQAYANDLLAICEALRIEDAVLVGHSAGAMAGALAAIKQPRRFAKLVLIAASPRYINDGDYHGGFTKAQLADLYSTVLGRFSEWVNELAPIAIGTDDRPDLVRSFADTLRTIPPERALTVLCSFLQSDHRADLARITQPTLLVHGRDDFFVPDSVVRFMQGAIRDGEVAWVNATGHFPHLVAPDETVAAMRAFLGD